ncbi:hypothetical protein IMG5_147510, partial [Ichthyophthirius multifiliis]
QNQKNNQNKMYNNQQNQYVEYYQQPPQNQQRPSYLQTPNIQNKNFQEQNIGNQGYQNYLNNYQQQTPLINQNAYNKNYQYQQQQQYEQPNVNIQQQYPQRENSQYRDNLNNIIPRTRIERGAMKDKEQMEKIRINQRVGYETRNQDVKQLLHNADPQSSLFISENQRFDKDFAIYDKQQRELKLQQKEINQEKHRIEGIERDSYRWQQMEKQSQREEIIREKRKDILIQCKKNTNGYIYKHMILLIYMYQNIGYHLTRLLQNMKNQKKEKIQDIWMNKLRQEDMQELRIQILEVIADIIFQQANQDQEQIRQCLKIQKMTIQKKLNIKISILMQNIRVKYEISQIYYLINFFIKFNIFFCLKIYLQFYNYLNQLIFYFVQIKVQKIIN